MVKFQKQLEGELVPEWKSAYCNYKALKKELKALAAVQSLLQHNVRISDDMNSQRLLDDVKLLRAGLSKRRSTKKRPSIENIKVNVEGSENQDQGVASVYKTQLLQGVTQADEALVVKERSFFARIDRQLNKVCEFHLRQEKELSDRARELWSQLETLLEMRLALKVQEAARVQAKKAYNGEDDVEEEGREQKGRRTDGNEEIQPGAEVVQKGDKEKDGLKILQDGLARREVSGNGPCTNTEESQGDQAASQTQEGAGVHANFEDHYEPKNEADRCCGTRCVSVTEDIKELEERAPTTGDTPTEADAKTSKSPRIEAGDINVERSAGASEKMIKAMITSAGDAFAPDEDAERIKRRLDAAQEVDKECAMACPEQESVSISGSSKGDDHARIIEKSAKAFTLEDARKSKILPDIVGRRSGETGLLHFRGKGQLQDDKAPPLAPNLQQVRLDLPATTPVATIRKLSHLLWEDMAHRKGSQPNASPNSDEELAFSRKTVEQADGMLRTALIEFYRAASLLRSYSALNTLAFVKILKKHDKIAGWDASSVYGSAVENAYFYTSNKVALLMETVEAIFTEHFASNSHRHAMQSLRPVHRSASHSVTFFLGLFLGLGLALLFAFAAILYSQGGYTKAGGADYLPSVFPVWSALALVLLHLYLYGWNVWAWRRCRINFAFIFESTPGQELRHRQVLLVCGGLTCVLLGGMVLHLAVRARKYDQNWASEIVPLATVLMFLVFLIQPCNVMYRSSRWFFLGTIWHCALAPLYKVVLADFFMGDQLTSQIPMLRNVEYILCYYGGGFFITRTSSSCIDSSTFRTLSYVVAMLPFWFRLMQCVRRLVDEGDRMHVYNGGKYLSAMVAVALRLAYTTEGSTALLVLFSAASAVAALYQIYWDLVVDWGLLRQTSSNRWLRDRLVLKRKWVYFASMVLNVVLRFAWLHSITSLQFGNLSKNVNDLIFAALEVLRRGQWNFYRLENEHLNNVGKFRAVRSVPLPFRDLDDSQD